MTTTTTLDTRRTERRTRIQALTRDSEQLLATCGIARSRSWVLRTVSAYLAADITGLPFGRFLMARVELNSQERRRISERADSRYLLTYADPVGETAIRNVMRGRALVKSGTVHKQAAS